MLTAQIQHTALLILAYSVAIGIHQRLTPRVYHDSALNWICYATAIASGIAFLGATLARIWE